MPDDGKRREHLKSRRVMVSDTYAVWKAKHPKDGTSKKTKQNKGVSNNVKESSHTKTLLVKEPSLTMDRLRGNSMEDVYFAHSEGNTSTSSVCNSINSSMSAEQLANRSLRKQQARARKVMNQKLAERLLLKSASAHSHLVQNQNDDDDEDMFTMFSWSSRRLSLVSSTTDMMDQDATAVVSGEILDLESPPVATLLPWFRRGSLQDTVVHRNTCHRRRSKGHPRITTTVTPVNTFNDTNTCIGTQKKKFVAEPNVSQKQFRKHLLRRIYIYIYIHVFIYEHNIHSTNQLYMYSARDE
jgi:hypothetical protein